MPSGSVQAPFGIEIRKYNLKIEKGKWVTWAISTGDPVNHLKINIFNNAFVLQEPVPWQSRADYQFFIDTDKMLVDIINSVYGQDRYLGELVMPEGADLRDRFENAILDMYPRT